MPKDRPAPCLTTGLDAMRRKRDLRAGGSQVESESPDFRDAVGHERRIHSWSRFDLTDAAPDGSATRSTELYMRSMHDRTAARARRSPMPQDAASAVRSSTLMLSMLVLPLITAAVLSMPGSSI